MKQSARDNVGAFVMNAEKVKEHVVVKLAVAKINVGKTVLRPCTDV